MREVTGRWKRMADRLGYRVWWMRLREERGVGYVWTSGGSVRVYLARHAYAVTWEAK